MKTILFLCATLALFFQQANAASVTFGKMQPKVIVVKIHADWCGACKQIQPTVDELKAEFSEKGVLFVTLDFTDAAKSAQSGMLAAELDIQGWVRVNNNTGMLLVYTAGEQAELDVFNQRHSKKEIAAGIQKHLG